MPKCIYLRLKLYVLTAYHCEKGALLGLFIKHFGPLQFYLASGQFIVNIEAVKY